MAEGGGFSNADHIRTLNKEQRDGMKDQDDVYESKLKGLVRNLKGIYKPLLLRAKIKGACLSVQGTTVSGTILSATEFRDFLCEHYNVSPLNLQSHCDGCGTAFEVTHTLICRIGGLVIVRHNKICDELLYLSQCTFTSEYERSKPLIHQGRTRSKQEICQGSDKDKETQGDVMIQGLWYCKVDTIIDIKLWDADVDMYKYEPMTALLARWEKNKKYKHGNHCHNQWISAVCYLSGRNAREGISSHSLSIQSIHVIEKGRTPFESTGVGKRTNQNRLCKFLLTDNTRSSAHQSPAGTGAGMGSKIRNRVCRLNYTPR